jgi:hypothetical protein
LADDHGSEAHVVDVLLFALGEGGVGSRHVCEGVFECVFECRFRSILPLLYIAISSRIADSGVFVR